MNTEFEFEFDFQLEVNELQKLFKKTILDFIDNRISKFDFLCLICSLTRRQCDCYAFLDSETKKILEEILFSIYNIENHNDIMDIMYIVINLGLQNCYEKIMSSLSKVKDIDLSVYNYLDSIHNKMGDDISNPYKSLRINK